MADTKTRLDISLLEKGLSPNRQRAQTMIMAGKVLVNDQPVLKPGVRISTGDAIRIKGDDIAYVSRGGLKLEKALQQFDVDVTALECMDIGASTGGFTDCLLQHDAKHVYAIDVGYGQLAWKLRQNPRVTVIERTNIRHMPLKKIPSPLDFAAIDVSFISLKIVVPSVLKFLKKDASLIALIKPQFEVGKGKVGKGGVVKDLAQHDEVIRILSLFFDSIGLVNNGIVPSPITGPKGNKEFFCYLKRCLS